MRLVCWKELLVDTKGIIFPPIGFYHVTLIPRINSIDVDYFIIGFIKKVSEKEKPSILGKNRKTTCLTLLNN